MTELTETLLVRLAIATLFLSLSAVVFMLALHFGRVRSPMLHRTAWAVTVLLGWVLWSVPIAVPWYESDPAHEAVPPPAPVAGYRPLDAGGMGGVAFSMPSSRVTAHAPPIGTPNAAPTTENPTGRSIWQHWPLAVTACWLAGLLGCLWNMVRGYVLLMHLLSSGRPVEGQWLNEWQEVLARAGVSKAIPLCVISEIGPALCRLPQGYILAIPAHLWCDLTPAQRRTILTHELAHHQRGDVWKSFAMRLLALPHWFNPFSWYAVRRFEECGEWACDEAVKRSDPDHATAYAKTLLELGQITQAGRLLSTAAHGGGLAVRIRRVLAKQSLEDSKMKKLLVGSLAAGLVLLCAVRIDLVAQESGDSSADAGRDASGGTARVEQAEAMVQAAKAAYESTAVEYDLGNVLMENLYVWSRRWLDAELTLIAEQWRGNDARMRASRAEAFRKHLKRMERLHERIAVLYKAAAIGGEATNYFGSKFFVAEASLWVERASGGREPPENGSTSNANGSNAAETDSAAEGS